jgi:acetyl esterase/lipase
MPRFSFSPAADTAGFRRRKARGSRASSSFRGSRPSLRIVRSRAATGGFDPNKIAIIGSSAGGHLAATLLTKWDAGNPDDPDPVERVSSRPDLGILCYPVITMGESTHGGSRDNLLGTDAPKALREELSAENHVSAKTPPCFVWHTWEDPGVPVDNPLLFVSALRKAGVPFECHIYQDGGHGLGMKDGITWHEDCLRWLERRLNKE